MRPKLRDILWPALAIAILVWLFFKVDLQVFWKSLRGLNAGLLALAALSTLRPR